MSGCATLMKGLGMEDAVTKDEVDAAKAKGDYAQAKDLCLQKERKQKKSGYACGSFLEMAIERKDITVLRAICTNQGDYGAISFYGTKYSRREHVCPAVRTVDRAAKGQVILNAPCETLQADWEKHASNFVSEEDPSNLQKAAERFIECQNWDFVLEQIGHWGEKKGGGALLFHYLASKGHDMEAQMLAYMKRHTSNPFAFKDAWYIADKYTDYLHSEGKYSRCKEYIPYTKKMGDKAWGSFNWYSRKANCASVINTIKKRLSSDSSDARIGACKTYGTFGKRKHLRLLKALVQTDPTYVLKTVERSDGFYKVKEYPVRDACRAAMGKIQVR